MGKYGAILGLVAFTVLGFTRPSHNPVQGVLTRTPPREGGWVLEIGHGGGVLER